MLALKVCIIDNTKYIPSFKTMDFKKFLKQNSIQIFVAKNLNRKASQQKLLNFLNQFGHNFDCFDDIFDESRELNIGAVEDSSFRSFVEFDGINFDGEEFNEWLFFYDNEKILASSENKSENINLPFAVKQLLSVIEKKEHEIFWKEI